MGDLPSTSGTSRRILFWSTRESIDHDIPSVTAIIETLLAIPLYWWIAIYFETYLPLLISVVIAPFVLLRSDESTMLGMRWFVTWEETNWRNTRLFRSLGSKERWLVLPRVSFSILMGGITATILARYLLANLEEATLWHAFAVGAVSGGVASAILYWYLNSLGLVAVVAGTALAQAAAAFLIGAQIDIPGIDSAVVASGILAIPMGVFFISVGIRIIATLIKIRPGLYNLPRNFRRLVLCTSPLQEPELVPGLTPHISDFTLMQIMEQLHPKHLFTTTETLRKSPPSYGAIRRSINKFGFFFLDVMAIPLWFFPAWFYRVTLKSTAWFWWPLAFLGSDLHRTKDLDEFRWTASGSLWAKTTVALASLAIAAFVFSNFILTGALFKDNPLLTVFGYFLVLDRPLAPWQLLTLAVAGLSLFIVFRLNYLSGQYEIAKKKNDPERVTKAERNLGWLERIARFRLVLFVVLQLVIGAQAALYFNSRNCWFTVPTNTERWAEWVYGAKLPEVRCFNKNSST